MSSKLGTMKLGRPDSKLGDPSVGVMAGYKRFFAKVVGVTVKQQASPVSTYTLTTTGTAIDADPAEAERLRGFQLPLGAGSLFVEL